MFTFSVLLGATEGAVYQLAQDGGWSLVTRVYHFDEFISRDDGSFGDIGEVYIEGAGYCALARRELAA